MSGFLWDKRLLKHAEKQSHSERPQRALFILTELTKMGVLSRLKQFRAREATLEELKTTHTKEHLLKIDDSSKTKANGKFNCDTYFNKYSAKTARLAVGGLIDFVEKVYSGELQNGFALVRPPGHHAGSDGVEGFCLLNNVAIATKCLQRKHNAKRILIVDWDVHHGNGTQDIFYNDDSVLFFSIHYWEDQTFYPYTGRMEDIGGQNGTGKNINVPLIEKGVGDDVYLAAFKEILVPVAKEFDPEIIIVSCGFDSAKGEKTQIMVTPHGYAKLTKILMEINPKIVFALEGGYYAQSLRQSAVGCCLALLGDELDEIPYKQEDVHWRTERNRDKKLQRFLKYITKIKFLLKPHWRCFKDVRMDSLDSKAEQVSTATKRSKSRSSSHDSTCTTWTPPRITRSNINANVRQALSFPARAPFKSQTLSCPPSGCDSCSSGNISLSCSITSHSHQTDSSNSFPKTNFSEVVYNDTQNACSSVPHKDQDSDSDMGGKCRHTDDGVLATQDTPCDSSMSSNSPSVERHHSNGCRITSPLRNSRACTLEYQMEDADGQSRQDPTKSKICGIDLYDQPTKRQKLT